MNCYLNVGKIENRILFLYGFFGTMPVVQIGGFTAFTWLTLILSCLILVYYNINLKSSPLIVPFVLISSSTIVSAVICMLSMLPDYWKKAQITNIVWQILYLLIFAAYCNERLENKCLFYIKGVYWAAIFQICWSLMQLVVYTIFGVSINKLIFYDYLGISEAALVQLKGNSIALTGLCWNVANLAPLLVIGYVFSKSIYMKIAFVVFSLISGSRTALLGVVTCIMLQVLFWTLKRFKDSKVKLRTVLIFFGGFVLLFMVAIVKREIFVVVLQKVSELLNMFNRDYMVSESSSIVHARYWTTIPEVTMRNHFIHNIFGYGIDCSGYPFSEYFMQYVGEAWVVECDFVNNLWNFGYLGAFLWYGWYFVQVIRSKAIDKRYWILFAGLLVEGVTYNVTFNWCYIFILMLFIQIMYKKNIFDIVANREV